MSLAQRLLLYSFFVITLLVVAILAIVDSRLYSSIIGENENSLEREARLIATQWRTTSDPDSLADAAGLALARRVTLVDSLGTVVGDSEFDGVSLRRLANHLFRPELVEARRVGIGVARRASTSRGDEELYVAVRANSGFARVSVETGTLEAVFDRARRDILVVGVIALVAAMILAAFFARKVSRPIIELRDLAHSFTERDFRQRRIGNTPGEVGDLARSLEQLSTRLEALESVRRDFVANVSHELRTPLTVVAGFAETLRDDDPPPDTRREFAGMIVSNTNRMQRIVDDLLDLSRIESGGWVPRPETVQIEDISSEVLASLENTARDKGLSVRTYVAANAATAWADRTALQQIVANLVENAIRYTDKGVVTIFSEPEASGVWIGVRDTGEGIAPERLHRIFERFYRVDTGRSREQGGTGLGLSIVRHLAEAHGGRVRAASRPGEGTSIAAFFPSPRGIAAL